MSPWPGRGFQIADVADMEEIESAVGQDDAAAQAALARHDGLEFGQRAELAQGSLMRACLSSSGEMTAVPFFMTTIPPAALASRAASAGDAPPARAAVRTLMTVSPAPVTSTMSVGPGDGEEERRLALLEKGHALGAAGDEQGGGAELAQERRARLAHGRLARRERGLEGVLDLGLVGRGDGHAGELEQAETRVQGHGLGPWP